MTDLAIDCQRTAANIEAALKAATSEDLLRLRRHPGLLSSMVDHILTQRRGEGFYTYSPFSPGRELSGEEQVAALRKVNLPVSPQAEMVLAHIPKTTKLDQVLIVRTQVRHLGLPIGGAWWEVLESIKRFGFGLFPLNDIAGHMLQESINNQNACWYLLTMEPCDEHVLTIHGGELRTRVLKSDDHIGPNFTVLMRRA